MAGYRNFDRQYRISCGPAGGTGFEIGATSPSQPVPLHISFSFQKSDLETQNTGKVTIWNLNKEHLAVLNEKDCVLVLKAGYGTVMPLIFTGNHSSEDHHVKHGDKITQLCIVPVLTPRVKAVDSIGGGERGEGGFGSTGR